MSIKRGDLFWADLNPVKGSEQAGRRPVVVLQNDIGNEYAPTVIIAPLTTTKFPKHYPTNVLLPKNSCSLKTDSTVLLSQIRVIDKLRLAGKIGHISAAYMAHIDEALRISLAL